MMYILLKILGWVLIAMQALALYGASMSGRLHMGNGITGLFELIGFFIFGIIGILLLIVGNKLKARKKEKAAADARAVTGSDAEKIN